jgi:hypothetical protein
LRSHSRGIELDQARSQDVVEAVFTNQHEQRRADTYQGVGAQPGTLLANFALHANEHREQKGHC